MRDQSVLSSPDRLEANTLLADLKAGRLMRQAIHQARLAYQFNPNTYTFEALNAAERLARRLHELLRQQPGETAAATPINSPQQEPLL
jgi:hypothetical protein